MADHDLWIAATALELGRPLVTKNVRHFHAVPGLEVVTY
jgi:predicted nucleic acid-binding protein